MEIEQNEYADPALFYISIRERSQQNRFHQYQSSFDKKEEGADKQRDFKKHKEQPAIFNTKAICATKSDSDIKEMALQEIFGSEMDSISLNVLEISLERFHIAEKGIDLL